MDEARLKLLEHQGFGYWLAGFIDGEGSFLIHTRTSRNDHRPRFKIAVRADDMHVMAEIAYRTGIGKLSLARGRASSGEETAWVVANQADCEALVEILDAFPLRAKKRRDFEIWREAVARRAAHRRGEPWDDMAQLKRELEEGRRYERSLKTMLAA